MSTAKILEALLNEEGIPHVREFKFLGDRRFRFDFALFHCTQKIAAEIEGGIFSNGRHTRGKGYQNDCEKYSLAAVHGWRILRFTTQDILKRPKYVMRLIKQICGMEKAA